jgi:hypothetical protein
MQGTPHATSPHSYPLLRDVQASFPGGAPAFNTFIETPPWKKARAAGLLLV